MSLLDCRDLKKKVNYLKMPTRSSMLGLALASTKCRINAQVGVYRKELLQQPFFLCSWYPFFVLCEMIKIHVRYRIRFVYCSMT